MKIKAINCSRCRALTLMEVIVLLCIVALLMLMLTPAVQRHEHMDQLLSCESNLKMLGFSFLVYSGDNNGRYPTYEDANTGRIAAKDRQSLTTIYQPLSFYISKPSYLCCPSDVRTGAVNYANLQLSNLSYFLSLSTTSSLSNAILGGDRNITVTVLWQNQVNAKY